MRLWSIHPKYLDSKGLVAVWREGLLARKVLQNKTVGFRNHPQLERFTKQDNPLSSIDAYLYHVWKEGKRRGYAFDRKKTGNIHSCQRTNITTGQLTYELQHLRKKLLERDPEKYKELQAIGIPQPHPCFIAKPGPVERWERLR